MDYSSFISHGEKKDVRLLALFHWITGANGGNPPNHTSVPIKGKVKIAEQPRKEKVKKEQPRLMGDVMIEEDRINVK